MTATPAKMGAAKEAAAPIRFPGDRECWFKPSPLCSNDGHAVAWLADGRGACGAHHLYLGRLPAKAKAA